MLHIDDPRLPERFWSKIAPEPNTGCWIWIGCITPYGYGQISMDGRIRGAHQVSYERAHGPVPRGLEIDHLCRVRSCCNPDHLEAVTRAVNMQRSPLVGKANLAKTHCPQGHEYTPANTKLKVSHEGWRMRACRTCGAEYMRAKRKRDGR